MSEHAHASADHSGRPRTEDELLPASGPDDLPLRANAPGLSLKAYVEREAAAIAAAGGPTMAEILEDLDHYRRPDGPTTEDIVNALHESRRERDEQIEAWWQQ